MKLIPLSKGMFAKVDDTDFEWLSQWKWYASTTKRSKTFYARRSKDDIQMHRLILELTDKNILTDHVDNDGLNNQRSNLRTASYSENNANIKSHSNSTSKFLGVHWSTRDKVWRTQINKNKRTIYIGSFENEIDAAKAYNENAVKYHGEFAKLNKVA